MATRTATTVKAYLAGLPAERRAVVQAVRKVILANLGAGYEEGMLYGMIGYYVPHRLYPAGYHVDPRQPLGYAGLAAQKNYYSLYLGLVYCGGGTGESDDTPDARWFRQEWSKTGKKLDMGKSCIRFRTLEDLPLELVGRAIARLPVRAYIAAYEKALAPRRRPSTRRRSKA
ncbi:MAG TPA: DUF1801 domain-containing protein [Planctomycetota bacterium]|nr:DUF1801 domain-containing protein [Planctomycetota bacterium]